MAKSVEKKEEPKLHLKEGEKVTLAKGKESEFYNRREAVAGIMVGKKQKYVK